MTTIDSLIAYAQAELGKPYVYGDEGPSTFDCSGLMQYVYGEIGISLPRTAAQQQKYATSIASPLPGDLVFYGNPAHHVALYVGNGMQIAAPHTGATVTMQKVSSGATYGRVPNVPVAANSVASSLAVNGLGADFTGFISGARSIAIEVLVAAAGAGLVVFGLYRAAAPRAKAAGKQTLQQFGVPL
jgi:NlpC/P60 family